MQGFDGNCLNQARSFGREAELLKFQRRPPLSWADKRKACPESRHCLKLGGTAELSALSRVILFGAFFCEKIFWNCFMQCEAERYLERPSL